MEQLFESLTHEHASVLPLPEKVTSENITEILKLNKIPSDITISTMTLICRTETIFNVSNIGHYLDLSYDKIFSVKYGSLPETNRTLNCKKKRRTVNNKKKKRNFYNQASIEAKSAKGKMVNIKLFSNLSIQITEYKTI